MNPPKNSQNFEEKAHYPDATPLKRTHSIPACEKSRLELLPAQVCTVLHDGQFTALYVILMILTPPEWLYWQFFTF